MLSKLALLAMAVTGASAQLFPGFPGGLPVVTQQPQAVPVQVFTSVPYTATINGDAAVIILLGPTTQPTTTVDQAAAAEVARQTALAAAQKAGQAALDNTINAAAPGYAAQFLPAGTVPSAAQIAAVKVQLDLIAQQQTNDKPNSFFTETYCKNSLAADIGPYQIARCVAINNTWFPRA